MAEWQEELGRKDLEINIKKNKVIHVGRKGKRSMRITCDSEQLVQVKEYEYLGVIFDRDGRIESGNIKLYEESKLYVFS